MYVKPPHRQVHGLYVPNNYNGTAFTEPPTEQPEELEMQAEAQQTQEPTSLPKAVETAKTGQEPLLSSLFSGFGGLRSDDLLLLALILLMSRSDDAEKKGASEILPLLALLLFLG